LRILDWIFFIAVVFLMGVALNTQSNKIEDQRQEIAKLETKLMWLENTDQYMLAIEAMSDMERDELKATNELIKQGLKTLLGCGTQSKSKQKHGQASVSNQSL